MTEDQARWRNRLPTVEQRSYFTDFIDNNPNYEFGETALIIDATVYAQVMTNDV